MTAILLALTLSESALSAAEVKDYRLVIEPMAEPSENHLAWTPGVDSWKRKNVQDCPAFFQQEMDGFGMLRVGPRCVEEEIPYAL
jgi:hypothetical protein